MADKQIRQLNSGTKNTSPALGDVLATQVDETDGLTAPTAISSIRDLIRGFGSNVLSMKEASNSADLEFDLSDVDKLVEFRFENIVPSSDSVRFELEVFIGSWQTTNYVYSSQYSGSSEAAPGSGGNSSTSEAHTSSVRISGLVGSSTGEGLSGLIQLDNPANTALYKTITGLVDYHDISTQNFNFVISGAYQGSTSAITKIRFKFESGNIESGKIYMIDPFAGGNMNPLAAPVRYERPTAQTLIDNTWTVLDFNSKDWDDDGLVTTGSGVWEYEAPHAGYFDVTTSVLVNDTAWLADEVCSARLERYTSSAWSAHSHLHRYELEDSGTIFIHLRGSATIYLAAGEKLRLTVNQGSGGDITTGAFAGYNYIIVNEVPSRLSTLDPAVRAKWSSGYTYAQGDITTKDGRTYKSVVDDNLGNNPTTDDASNWVLQPEIVTGDYSYVTMSADQLDPAAGTVVALNTEQVGNIPFNSSTYKWTLRANRTYILHCFTRSINHLGTDALRLIWQNASGDIGSSSLTRGLPSTDQSSNQSDAFAIYTPTADTDVWVEVDQNTSGTVDISSTATWAAIYQIGVGAYVPLMAPVKYRTTTAQNLTDSSDTVINYDTKIYDDDNCVTTGASWEFEAPHNGYYKLTASLLLNTTADFDADETFNLKVQKYVSSWVDESVFRRLDMQANPSAFYANSFGSDTFYLNAGEKLRVVGFQNSGDTRAIFTASDVYNYISIEEVPTATSVPKIEWVEYTPTVYGWTSGFGTCLGRYKDLGNELIVDIRLPVTGAVGPGATNLSIGLPSGYQLDLLGNNAGGEHRLGYGLARDSGTASYSMDVETDSTNLDRVLPLCKHIGGTYVQYAGVQAAVPFTWANGDSLHLQLRVPVTRT